MLFHYKKESYSVHLSKYSAKFLRTLAFCRLKRGRLGVGDGGGGHLGVSGHGDAGGWEKRMGREGVGGGRGILGVEEMGVE